MSRGVRLRGLGRAIGPRVWLGIAAVILTVVAAVLSWTVLSSTDPAEAHELAAMAPGATHRNAFDSGFYAWGSVSVTVLTGLGVAVLGRFRTIRAAGLPRLWLVTGLLAVALSVIGFFAMRLQFGSDGAAALEAIHVDIGAGPGRWLGLAAAVLALAASVLDVYALRGEARRSGERSRSGAKPRLP